MIFLDLFHFGQLPGDRNGFEISLYEAICNSHLENPIAFPSCNSSFTFDIVDCQRDNVMTFPPCFAPFLVSSFDDEPKDPPQLAAQLSAQLL